MSGLDDYLRLLVRALPNPVDTAHQLSATVTLVQTAVDTLRDDQPGSAKRAEVAQTLVLAGLTGLTKDYEEGRPMARQYLAGPGW